MIISFDIMNENYLKKMFIDPPISTVRGQVINETCGFGSESDSVLFILFHEIRANCQICLRRKIAIIKPKRIYSKIRSKINEIEIYAVNILIACQFTPVLFSKRH